MNNNYWGWGLAVWPLEDLLAGRDADRVVGAALEHRSLQLVHRDGLEGVADEGALLDPGEVDGHRLLVDEVAAEHQEEDHHRGRQLGRLLLLLLLILIKQ